MMHDDILVLTKAWLEKVVIGLGLCPFAFEVYSKDKIKYHIANFQKADDFAHDFLGLANDILQLDTKETTSLLIVPEGLEDFHDYLSVYESLEALLETQGLHDKIQLASFHPQYQFAGNKESDVENFTNRSPYPVIHLLRVDDVTTAINEHPDVEEIPVANIRKLNEMGESQILQLWKSFSTDQN